MTCRKYRKELSRLLDRELSAERAAELEAWFASCAEVRHCSVCRKLIDEHKSLQYAFQSTPQSEFPAFLHERIMASVRQEAPVYRKQAIRKRWQLVPAAIAILLSIYVGSLIGLRTFNTQTPVRTDRSALRTFGDNGLVSTLYINNGDME